MFKTNQKKQFMDLITFENNTFVAMVFWRCKGNPNSTEKKVSLSQLMLLAKKCYDIQDYFSWFKEHMCLKACLAFPVVPAHLIKDTTFSYLVFQLTFIT